MMDDDQQFCLRWNNHQSTLISVFDTLLENGTLVDCTLAAEGQFLKAHKVVLSACSPYFANLLKEQYDKHPIFILKDVKYQELRAMMDYMYRGEVNISQDQLAALLKAAESLQIKGLSDNRSPTSGQQQHQQQQQQQQHQKSEQHQKLNVPGIKNNSGGGGGGGSGGGGYTLEQTKRPRIGPTSIDSQDINREGSSSPTSRKRKKIRRRSVENVMDNHEHSNSSAHSIQQINSTAPMTSINTSGTSAVVSALQSSSNTQQTSVNISKKTESVLNIKQNIGGDIITTTGTTISAGNTNTGTTDDDNQNDNELMKPINKKEQNHKRKQQQQQQHEKDELLLEPKNEYDDVNETIEDLTEDPDDEDIMDEDIGQAGPSHHGGEGSSQGFPQWPADRSQDEFIMAAQDQGQQRDPQGSSSKPTHLGHPIKRDDEEIAKNNNNVNNDDDDDDDDDEDNDNELRSQSRAIEVDRIREEKHHPESSHISSRSSTSSPSPEPLNLQVIRDIREWVGLNTQNINQMVQFSPTLIQQHQQPAVGAIGSSSTTIQSPTINLQQLPLAHQPHQQHHHQQLLHQSHTSRSDTIITPDDNSLIVLGNSGIGKSGAGTLMSQQQAGSLSSINLRHHSHHPKNSESPLQGVLQQQQQHHQQSATAPPISIHSLPSFQFNPMKFEPFNFSMIKNEDQRHISGSSSGGGGGVGGGGVIAAGICGVGGSSTGGSNENILTGGTGSHSPGLAGSSSSSNITPGTSIGGGSGWGAFSCSRCGNSYARPHSLNRHLRFECGVEPKFECPICHKKSKHKHNLVLHMRTHNHR